MVALAAISSSPVAGAASLSINDTSDHIISGTEPTTVWTVTFAGASNHQAVVDLGGDGTRTYQSVRTGRLRRRSPRPVVTQRRRLGMRCCLTPIAC